MGRRTTRAFAAASLALAMVLTACGGTNGGGSEKPANQPGDTAGPTIQPEGSGDPFVDARAAASHMPMTAQALTAGFVKAANVPGDPDSAAAQLRVDLTALLQEHVYLAGIAVATAYAKGPQSPEFKAAAAVVDANATDVSKAVGSVAGDVAGQQFGAGFTQHIKDFVSYAVAAKAGDKAGKADAVASLVAYAGAQGEFWSKATKGALPATAVQHEFTTHITSLAKAVDALAAGDPQAYNLLRAAASHMPMMAQALAGGVAKATNMKGDPNSPAATLRANLTALLQEHVYLAGIAVFTAYTSDGGVASPAFKAAAATLDANSVALSKGIGSLAGPDDEKAFLVLWRQHIADLVDYAGGAAAKDGAKKADALKALDAYRGTAGEFFEKASKGNLPAGTVAESLKMHITTLAGAIDSMAAALVRT